MNAHREAVLRVELPQRQSRAQHGHVLLKLFVVVAPPVEDAKTVCADTPRVLPGDLVRIEGNEAIGLPDGFYRVGTKEGGGS